MQGLACTCVWAHELAAAKRACACSFRVRSSVLLIVRVRACACVRTCVRARACVCAYLCACACVSGACACVRGARACVRASSQALVHLFYFACTCLRVHVWVWLA